MNENISPYEARFAVGSMVQIADRQALEGFRGSWKFHHPLTLEQLEFAGSEARVKSVSFYHGGDELYWLEGVPGTWHPECLQER